MEQGNNDNPPSTTFGTTSETKNSIDSDPMELPKFLEFKETRSQQIIARLKLLEDKILSEINSIWSSQTSEEKTSQEIVEKLKDALQIKIQEFKTQMVLQVDYILVSEVLQILAKEEENLIEFVRDSMENFHVKSEDQEKIENETNTSGGISKKVISKMEKKDNQKRKKIPYKAVAILKQWLFDHIQDPYPSNQVKEDLAKKTNLNFKQVHNWFINARGRIWKKMVHQERFGDVVKKLYVPKVNKK